MSTPSRPASSRTGAVLLTRPRPAAEGTARRLAELGWRALIAPLLEILPAERDVSLPARTQAVLITSANAVPHLPRAARRLPLLAVGEASAAAARGAGWERVESAHGDGAALARLAAFRLDPRSGPLFLAVGEGQGQAVARALERLGFAVERGEVYRTRPVLHLPPEAEAALAEPALHGLRAALFFSAETARVFRRLYEERRGGWRLGGLAAVAISPASAPVLGDLPWRRLAYAGKPDQEGLLARLAEIVQDDGAK